MKSRIKKLTGANMDIDLISRKKKVPWRQDKCPWNVKEKNNKHKCAVKNISICQYFCGIEYADKALCCYPNKNPKKGS